MTAEADAARPLDPRLHAWRPDLAAAGLRGQVDAAQFADPAPARIAAGTASVREQPRDDARQATELLYGEAVDVIERAGGWAWVQNRVDGYVGYVREAALGAPAAEPTHRVSALRSYLFDGPDLKLTPRGLLHMTSPVAVAETRDDGWSRLADTAEGPGGYLWTRHLCPLVATAHDWIATARRFLGAPYAWGGRSSTGLDCSALVQLALARAGIAAPRDSDMQAAGLGEPVEGEVEAARPGDVLCWPGHVAFMVGGQRILHANAFHMAVAQERLADFRARTLEKVGDVRAVRRPVAAGTA
ncbi:NlpC/P60 family protein [Thalassobaculum sp.]|uniref:C40 family peptidase n=1 Tax=Thalassobaculum sp. TaxID=2022740 RepID=UPI0032EFC958